MSQDGFTVKRMFGCRVVYGPVPISDFGMLVQGFSDAAMMDMHLAEFLGASFVLGEPEDLAILRQQDLPPSAARPANAGAASQLGLDDVAAWLATGDRTASSEAMCKRIFGIPKNAGSNHPNDPADLRRCLLFCDVTKSHDKVVLMKDVSSEWSRLISNWVLITATLKDEMQRGTSAPATYELMKAALRT